MTRTLIAIGGGEIRSKETLPIDRQIATLAQKHAGDARPVALFIGTASHDSMPYYNSFHKTYTGELGLKTDCVLTVYGEMNYDKIADKFQKADVIYVGGGDTIFMLESWQKSGVLELIRQAYIRGVPLCGLSAGAICWMERIYTDSSKNGDEQYRMEQGLGWIKGGACPHFEDRKLDFEQALVDECSFVCLPNNSAVVYYDEVLQGQLPSLAQCSIAQKTEGGILYQPLPTITL